MGTDGISLSVADEHRRVLGAEYEDVPQALLDAWRVLWLAAFKSGNRVAPLLQEWAGAHAVTFDPDATIDVSVLVPVRGAHEQLRVCLEHLARQETSLRWEVILACCAEERSAVSRIACEAACRAPIVTQVVTSPHPQGYPENVNLARSHANGEIFVTLNSDAYVPRHTLNQLWLYLQDPSVVAVGPAVQHRAFDYTALGRDVIDAKNDRVYARDAFRTSRLVGFCLAVKRWAWNAVGGLDERYGIGNFDDDDLCLRLSLIGDILADRTLVVGHSVSASFAALGAHAYADAHREGLAYHTEKWGWLLPAWRAWMTERGALPAGGIVG